MLKERALPPPRDGHLLPRADTLWLVLHHLRPPQSCCPVTNTIIIPVLLPAAFWKRFGFAALYRAVPGTLAVLGVQSWQLALETSKPSDMPCAGKPVVVCVTRKCFKAYMECRTLADVQRASTVCADSS